MLVIAIIPASDGEIKQYIIQASEVEIDKISGISEVVHIEGRIKVGHEIVISEVYDKLEYFAKHKKELKAAEKTLREIAKSIKKLLPKET